MDKLKNEYFLLIAGVRKVCPNATVVVSSVLPRSSKRSVNEGYKELNKNILRFNSSLFELCKNLDGVKFCNNYHFSAYDDHVTPRDEVYVDDVHLTEKGKEMLSDSLFRSMKNAYFKNKVLPEVMNCKSLSEVLDAPSE